MSAPVHDHDDDHVACGGHGGAGSGPKPATVAVRLAPGERAAAVARARRLNQVSLGWNVVEGVVAVVAGIAAGSVSLIGFGIDSGIEVSAALILAWRLHQERRSGCMVGYDRTATGSYTRPDGVVVDTVSDDARLRSLVEAGADLESRAARVYSLNGFNNVDAVLHSIEPRINYTWIDGNTFGKIPNWGSPIDVIPRTSLLTYSLINRLRARTIAPEGTEPTRWEFMRFTVGQTYDFQNETRPFGNLGAELIVDPTRIVRFRGDTTVSPYGEGFQTGNTDLALILPALTAAVGTRFNKADNTRFLQGNLTTDLTRWATARVITNFDLNTDTVVENRFGVDLKWQCWAATVEYVHRSVRGDELRFAINLLGMGAPFAIGTGIGALSSTTGPGPTAGRIR